MPAADKDSILTSTKKMLGIAKDYTAFDLDILLHINSVFSTLQQLGVGLTDSQFEVQDENDTWESALSTQKNLVMIKSYMYLRVRQMFDPLATGFATESFANQIKEMEWRITVAASSTPNRASDAWTEPGNQNEHGVWNLTGLSDFPDAAAIGDYGIDYSTGKVWRKT